MARLSICRCVPVIGVRYTSLAGVLTNLITYINRLYLQLAGFVLHLKTVFNVPTLFLTVFILMLSPFIRQFIDFVRHFKPTGGANTAMSAMLRQKPVSVLVLGHSYVCRLRDHLDATGQVNFNLKPVGHSVHFRGISGLQFPRLMRELPSLGEAGHDMVLLDFGTNDLSAGCSPDILVDMVMSVAETLVATHTSHLCVLALEFEVLIKVVAINDDATVWVSRVQNNRLAEHTCPETRSICCCQFHVVDPMILQ